MSSFWWEVGPPHREHPVTLEALDAQLQPILPQQVQITRVISLAQCVGVSAFSLVCGIIASTHTGPALEDTSGLVGISALAGVLTLVLWPLSFAIPRLRTKAVAAALQSDTMAGLNAARASQITALAMREGAALIGLVAVMVAATGGQLPGHLWALADYLPGLAFVVHTVATLPNATTLRAELVACLAAAD